MIEKNDYLLGSRIRLWNEGLAKDITFIVTEDCNLACKYCYITGKNKKNKMSFEIAKKAVDYILNHPEEFPEKSVIWDFIGGEPFLEIELIDQICDYIKMEMYRLNHRWFENYRFNFSTNGILYHTPAVQRFIKKNKDNLSIGFSIDGNKIKHDLQRIKPDGSGSYDDVVKNVPLWLEQFPFAATKATFASADLPYLKDSIISLWKLGIKTINANIIFENDWKEGDDLIFEIQLKELADYIIENHLWDKFNCSFFLDSLGFPLTDKEKKQNWCGTGKMLAIDYRGFFFPCVRFVGYSLNKRDEYIIGDVENGYYHSKIRPFLALNLVSQSSEECINCQVASGCSWCQGLNYDEAEIDTLYQRVTYICKMHKARVRANDYYWNRLRQEHNIRIMRNNLPRKDYLYFIMSDDSVRHCGYELKEKYYERISLETFKKGLDFAWNNFYTPVLLLPKGKDLTGEERELLKGRSVIILHDPSVRINAEESMVIYDNSVENIQDGNIALLIIAPDKLKQLSEMVIKVFEKQDRINLILDKFNEFTDEDLKNYEDQLDRIVNYLIELHKKGIEKEINALTDRIYLKEMANCNAGVDSFALAPDGNFYICPAFYFDSEGEAIGSLEKGITFNYQELLTQKKSPICSVCDAYHCKRCVYRNRRDTGEYLIPDRNQCVISHIERRVSKKLAQRLKKEGLLKNISFIEEIFPELDYLDPLEKAVRK